MITFSKFFESILDGGKRILKVNQYGPKTADESSPFGIDSNPIKGMTAIYADTSNSSESVVLGVINESQLADNGELRLYSMDSNKVVKSFIWIKKDGTIEFNGNTYSSVRFEPLKTGLNNQNTLINTELSKIASAIGLLGGVYVPSNILTNIDSAKNDTVKLS